MLLLAMLTAYISALAQGGQAIFQVGGQDVYAGDFLHHHPEYTAGGDTSGLCRALQQYADFRTMVCEASRLRLDTTTLYRKAMDYHRHQEIQAHITSSPRASKIVQELILQSKYQYRVWLMRFDIYSNSHGDTATAYRKAIRAKEMAASGSFEATARQISDEPSTKSNGGYLGWASPVNIPAGHEILEYIYAHHNGGSSISRPIRSGNSYYIVIADGRRHAIDTLGISPIIIRKTPRARINDSIRTLMLGIEDKLKAGADFGQLQTEYSDIKFGQRMSLEQACRTYSTHIADNIKEGGYSPMMETPDFFCIARIDYTHALDVSISYQKALRERIPGTVVYQNMSQYFMDSIKSISGYSKKGNLAVIAKLMPDSTIFEAKWQPGNLGYLSQTLFTYGGQNYSYADFAEYIKATQYVTAYCKIPEYVEERYQDYLNMITASQAYALMEQSNARYRKALANDSHEALHAMLRLHPSHPKGMPTMQQALQYSRETGLSPKTSHSIRMRLYSYHDAANKKKAMKNAEALAMDSTAAPGLATLAESGTYQLGMSEAADMIIAGLDSGKYRMPANRLIYLDQINSFAIVEIDQRPEPLSDSETYSIVASNCAAHIMESWMSNLRQRHGLAMQPNACQTVAEALR